MKKLLLLLIIPFLSFGQTDIVGGDDANIQDYPYMAALIGVGWWGSGYAFCGASIINEYWILTAAHCMSGQSANNTSVRVGTSTSYAQGGDTYDVAEIILHPNYNPNTMSNDIALIRLEDPIVFSNQAQPISLISGTQVALGLEDSGEMCWTTGWGEDQGTANDPNQLQVVEMPITNQSNYQESQISANMIMAGYTSGSSSCQGDSGGPMVVLASDGQTYLQCGIVSWSNGCGVPGYPSVFTRISYFLDWICENTEGAVCPSECEPDETTGSCIISPPFPNICPLQLPDAIAGELYSADLTFWMPAQFSAEGFDVVFDQLVVTQINGLPLGLSSDLSMVYYPVDSEFGCANVNGIPLTAGDYIVTVSTVANVTVTGVGFELPYPLEFDISLTVNPGSDDNVSLTYSTPNGCNGDFEALITSEEYDVQYNWNFGNGETSSAQYPTAPIYDEPGEYNVTLTTTLTESQYQLNNFSVDETNMDCWGFDNEEACIDLFGAFQCWGDPDLLIKIYDANGNLVFQTDYVTSTTASWSNLDFALNNPPYTVSILDTEEWDDLDDLGGLPVSDNDELATFTLNIEAGQHSFNSNCSSGTYFISSEIVAVHPPINESIYITYYEECGCLDTMACNYNSLATYNDGSCIYLDGICETCEDVNNDGILEIIDNDSDDDGLCNDVDSCEGYDDSVDVDGDGIADGCDVCPNDADNDADGDGICGDVDVCEGYDDNVDVDGDGTADGCDVCPNDEYNDTIYPNGICDDLDILGCMDSAGCNYNSLATYNDGSCIYLDGICETCEDVNNDGILEIIDNDSDDDGLCNDVDSCEGYDDSVDVDGDGIADGCDVCPNDADNDADGDGICGDVDVCEGYDDNVDVDGDGTADGCDVCPNDEYNDTIYPNGICDDLDILGCMDSAGCNYNSLATYNDGACTYIDGVCETCEAGFVVDNDIDNDGVCDVDELSGCQDSAACNYNVLATDSDGSCIYLDGICETCEDVNNDGIAEIIDNDSDDDGLCNDIDIAGCTNSDDCNYNPNATEYALESCSCLLEDFVSNICYVSVENENVILYWNSFGGECSVSVLEQTSPSNWSEYTVSESFNTNSYNIYRENQFGEYVWLNTVQSNEDNLSFVDTESNALQQSYSYLLTTIDDCGNESALETISRHKTIHLSSNQGINGEINLLWNPYEGFDYNVFDIWRSNNGGDFELIGQVSTSNLTYTDLTPPIGQNQYFISVTQLDECAIIENARVSSVNSSQSNTLDLTNSSSSISDLESYRVLLGIIDVLGRETHNNKDFQLHIYDDGSVEKKYLIK